MGRIRYGLSNLHYAEAAEGTGGALTYETPEKIPGAKSMQFTAAGADIAEPADNTTWYAGKTNDGYTGSIEFEDTASADAFMENVNGMTKAQNGLVVEKADDLHKEFALLGQMELAGAVEVAKRVCFYRCIASRPDINAQTKEIGGMTIATNVVNITVLPRINDNAVKSSAVSTDTVYNTFFSAVPEAA